MRTARFWIPWLLCWTTSCASLAIEPEDSLGARVGKLSARLPLTVLTLSLSEVRIQQIEAARERDAFEAEQRARIDEARRSAAAAATYDEYREWIDYATELEAELERRRAARAPAKNAARSEAGPEPSVDARAPTGCVSKGEGHTVVTECR